MLAGTCVILLPGTKKKIQRLLSSTRSESALMLADTCVILLPGTIF
jgi:hypothetical protein